MLPGSRICDNHLGAFVIYHTGILTNCPLCNAESRLLINDLVLKPETPFETFERVTRIVWPGGDSPFIRFLLVLFHITGRPGSVETNLNLQKALINWEKINS